MTAEEIQGILRDLRALDARVRRVEYAAWFIAGALVASPVLTASLVRLLA